MFSMYGEDILDLLKKQKSTLLRYENKINKKRISCSLEVDLPEKSIKYIIYIKYIIETF